MGVMCKSPAETRKGMILTTNDSYKHPRNVKIRSKRQKTPRRYAKQMLLKRNVLKNHHQPPISMLHHLAIHLQDALDSESSNIGLNSLVDVAVEVDKGVPGVEDHTEGWGGRVNEDALHVVAAGTGAHGLN